MRILLHGINFAPEIAGVGRYTGEMAEWLVACGHEVRVVTAPPYYPQWHVSHGYHAGRYATERWQGTRIWRCPTYVPRHQGGPRRLLHLASFAVSSFPVMLAQLFWRPDVVWVVEPPLFCAPTAWLVARLCGACSWLHIQDLEVDAAFEVGFLRGSTVRHVVAAWEGFLMRRFDRVSTISGHMLERVRKKGVDPKRLALVPNWVDLAGVVPPEGPNPIRVELRIAPDEIVALYSGTIGRKQGLELLAQAASTLQNVPKLIFVFGGNGSFRAELEASCQGMANVRFLDLQPTERLGALLWMADVHLLPQRVNTADLGMPSKLTGMLASGRPIVAACDLDTGIGQVVKRCGLIAPPGDQEAFAAAIQELVADQAQREQLGRAARAYAEQHLSRDVVLADFEKALENAVLDSS